MYVNKLYLLYILVIFVIRGYSADEDQDYWREQLNDDLRSALKIHHNMNRAKNIIIFIGDGMGPNTVTASRIYHKTEKGKLAFEEFPHVGLIKTYSGEHLVPDSASTATALFAGQKVNTKTAGVDMTVKRGDCLTASNPKTHLETVLTWAQTAKKSTGFVTTTRITHATPMALYAHIADRDWECNSAIPEQCQKLTKDIARQLIEDEPGKNLQVIMGGGIQSMRPKFEGVYDNWTCLRTDDRDLINEWATDKKTKNLKYAVLTKTADVTNLNTKDIDYVLGVFANGHLPFENERDKSPNGQPSLINMTEAAIKILKKNKNGFFLMVEGGLIDQANHRGKARKALEETVQFSETIRRARELLTDVADETLIIVTSDHAHSLTINGYTKRENGVLGISQVAKVENVPFTTLLYAIGGPNNYQYSIVDGKIQRADPSLNKTDDFEYSQQSGILNDETMHGGVDVAIWATGPMAHLFHSLHEQPYVARVMAYAAGFNTHFDRDVHVAPSSSAKLLPITNSLLINLIVFYAAFIVLRFI